MAKIKMDASEWEAMKKNEKLLEESLKKQEDMSDKIEKLQQEKIEALKSNEKIVTIVKKVESYDRLLCKVSPHHIQERIMRIARDIAKGPSSADDSMFDSRFGFDYRHSSISTERYLTNECKRLQEMFYTERSELNNLEKNESITYKGLDQVKSEIASEYIDNMSKKHKQELDRIKDFKSEISSLESVVSEQKIMLKNNNSVIKDLESSRDLLIKDVSLLKEENSLLLPRDISVSTRKILSNTRGFITNAKRLKELDKLWRA